MPVKVGVLSIVNIQAEADNVGVFAYSPEKTVRIRNRLSLVTQCVRFFVFRGVGVDRHRSGWGNNGSMKHQRTCKEGILVMVVGDLGTKCPFSARWGSFIQLNVNEFRSGVTVVMLGELFTQLPNDEFDLFGGLIGARVRGTRLAHEHC